MKPGDLLRRKALRSFSSTDVQGLGAIARAGELALLLRHYVSVNQVTGEEYKCAEIMWLKDKHVSTASYTIFEVVSESR